MTNLDNQKYLIPMEVTKETIKDFNIDSSQVVPAKIKQNCVSHHDSGKQRTVRGVYATPMGGDEA